MKCPACNREYTTRIRIKTIDRKENTAELICSKCGFEGRVSIQQDRKEEK